MRQRLVMMWDWASSGLWEAATGDGIRLEDLPLRDATRAAMRDWIRRIDDANDALMGTDDDGGLRVIWAPGGVVEPLPWIDAPEDA